MYRLDDDSIAMLKRNPGLQDLSDARRRFLVTLGPDGREVPRGPDGWQVGLFNPGTHWDQMPPIAGQQQRVVVEGKARIVSVWAGTMDDIGPSGLPEAAWGALAGGRVVVTPATVSGSFSRHRIDLGELDNAAILGTASSPLVFQTCHFERCTFFRCHFEHVRFAGCRFRASDFMSCRFTDCLWSECDFTDTVWGDPELVKRKQGAGLPERYNLIVRNRVEGKAVVKGSRGFGPAPFMTPDESGAARATVDAVIQARLDQSDDTDATTLTVWSR